MTETSSIGTVVSDSECPTFERVRVKLKAGCDLKPGALVKIPTDRTDGGLLIGRVQGAHEWNPNEQPDAVGVRDTLNIPRNYPREEDSTTIYRVAEVELIEELIEGETRAPETLPNAGADVFAADVEEIVHSLGLAEPGSPCLMIGHTATGTKTEIRLKREIIQRHLFICGTTGSGKSYSMGVVAEELVDQGLPIVFIDTQDEYSAIVEKLGGQVLTPGKDFTLRISSLTEQEVLDLVPTDSDLHKNMIGIAYNELWDELKAKKRTRFLVADLVDRIRTIGPRVTNSTSSVDLAARRTAILERMDIFGDGEDRANWPKLMTPCLAIKCKHLTMNRLQTVATAVLRELQNLRLDGFIPPYVAVVDEAHLFVPDGDGSPCKQIIREGVRIGRHHGICMVLLTQSPVDIDKRAIRQCNTRMVFALEPDQLDAIRGVKADASEEMLRALPKMPRGTCVLSGTYESIKHAIPVRIRQRKHKESEGGKAPPIFEEMANKWLNPSRRI
jgi:DNA helicase HerA-like ATPase